MLENWTNTTLGTLGEFRNGVNFGREQEGPGIPILKVKDFGSRTFAPTEGLDELALNASELPAGQVLKDGDIVIIRSNGNSALVGRSVVFRDQDRPTTFSGFCIRFRPNPELIDAAYAAYFLRSPFARQRFSAYGSGTGIQNLSQTILRELPISLPTKNEQRAIVQVLSALDDKVSLNEQTDSTLEAIARVVFKSWFVDFDPVRAKAQDCGPYIDPAIASIFPNSFDDSALGQIPRGWRLGTVSELAELSRDSLNPGHFPEEIFDHYSIPAFDESHWPAKEAGAQIKSNKTLVPTGSVLLSKLNPRIPRIWMPLVDQSRRSVASTEFLVATPKADASREFIYCLFSSSAFMEVFATLVTGTSGSHQRVRPDSLLEMEIAVPPPSVLDCFTQLIAPSLSKRTASLAESRTLLALRDALLPKLVSGELRVKQFEGALS